METILIRAEVISENEKMVTVRVLNGFGSPEINVHKDNVVEQKKK